MESTATRLSDNQRRFVCRLVFLQFCLIPTIASVYIILHQPDVNDWKQLIQSRLPIQVEIAAVETPLPGQVVLRGLQVVPTNSGRYPELDGFEANEVNIQFGLMQNEISFLEPVEIESRALANTLRRMFRELDDHSLDNERWQVSFRKVVLQDSLYGTNDFVLKPLSVTLAGGTTTGLEDDTLFQARILARPQGDDPDQQISVQFEKYMAGQYVLIDTQQGYLPANFLKHLVADAPAMGANSTFQGEIELAFDIENRADGRIQGNITNLKLDSLPDHGRRLTGYCDVNNLLCSIRSGRIAACQLNAHAANPISVDKSLFRDAEQFGIELSVDADSQRISIAKLNLGVNLSNGDVAFSAPRTTIERFGNREPAECFAFDAKGEPLAICNSRLSPRKSVPLDSLAKILTGQTTGNRSIDFLEKFHLPERSANRNDTFIK